MAKKKTTSKKTVHHHHDHHDLVLLSSTAIILLILFGGFFAVRENPEIVPEPIRQLIQLNGGENVSTSMRPATADLQMEQFSRNLNTQMGDLMDVSGGNSSGKAYVLRTEDGLKHMVIANLPDPEEGSVYEGWLVKQEPELMFFSTGVMEKQYDGRYTLMYEDDQLHEGFDFVVITLETQVDATPEAHILEGKVQ